MKKVKVGEIFTISDENEEEPEVINMDEAEYIAVSFVEDLQKETEEDIDICLLKVDQDGDFAAIESDEEFNRVSSDFDEIMKED